MFKPIESTLFWLLFKGEQGATLLVKSCSVWGTTLCSKGDRVS